MRSTTLLFTPRCTSVQVLGVNLGQSHLHCNISCQNAWRHACHRVPRSSAPYAVVPLYPNTEAGSWPPVRVPHPSGRPLYHALSPHSPAQPHRRAHRSAASSLLARLPRPPYHDAIPSLNPEASRPPPIKRPGPPPVRASPLHLHLAPPLSLHGRLRGELPAPSHHRPCDYTTTTVNAYRNCQSFLLPCRRCNLAGVELQAAAARLCYRLPRRQLPDPVQPLERNPRHACVFSGLL
jgi:hypothetical protein